MHPVDEGSKHTNLFHVGTVPTLVVPIEKTLQADMEVRYKALTETKVSLEYDKPPTNADESYAGYCRVS